MERKEAFSTFERKSSLEGLAQNILEWSSPSNASNTIWCTDTWWSRDLRSAECAILATRIFHNSPLQNGTGVWNLRKKLGHSSKWRIYPSSATEIIILMMDTSIISFYGTQRSIAIICYVYFSVPSRAKSPNDSGMSYRFFYHQTTPTCF